jgi:hypothetical protein
MRTSPLVLQISWLVFFCSPQIEIMGPWGEAPPVTLGLGKCLQAAEWITAGRPKCDSSFVPRQGPVAGGVSPPVDPNWPLSLSLPPLSPQYSLLPATLVSFPNVIGLRPLPPWATQPCCCHCCHFSCCHCLFSLFSLSSTQQR